MSNQFTFRTLLQEVEFFRLWARAKRSAVMIGSIRMLTGDGPGRTNAKRSKEVNNARTRADEQTRAVKVEVEKRLANQVRPALR